MKFSEFNKSTPEVARQAMVLDGTFGCQICDVQVDEAEWFQNERILRWSCPEGHVSFIEDFSL